MQKKFDLDLLIKKVWKRVLKCCLIEIGDGDNFFSLGGSQLEAIKAVSILEDDLDCILPADLFIKHPEFRGAINTIRSITNQGEAEPDNLLKIMSQKNTDLDFSRDIAVIGMETCFPGSSNKNDFWENLKNGMPLSYEAFYRRTRLAKKFKWNNTIHCIDDIEKFDNNFFNITDKDAVFIDPQQRVLLETVYHALEDAGIAYRIGEGANIGVYVGTSYLNYTEMIMPYCYQAEVCSPEIALSLCLNIISARVSYVFNFKGPAISFDTACSSSLTALNYAVNDLRLKKTDYAVVAGINLIITPIFGSLLRGIGIVGDDEKCKAFDEEAKGTVLGEGAGVVILQRLAESVKDKKRVYGVIKGIGITNDGLSMGIMTPNPEGQYTSMVNAYQDAGVPPSSVTYIEAHGTGTKMGDPIEIHALKKFFGRFTQQKRHCGIGSVKSNIGHLLSASGIAGLIKALLCIYHGELVPSLNITMPNRRINFQGSPFFLCMKKKKWEPGELPRIAGVNSFGIGGTNVHTVLREALPYRPESTSGNRWYVLTLSAKSAYSLEQNIRGLSRYLDTGRPASIGNLCYSYNCLKPHYKYRKAFVVKNGKQLAGQLAEFSRAEPPRKIPKIAFLFPDIIKRQTALGEKLYFYTPLFRQIADSCIVIVNDILSSSGDNQGQEKQFLSLPELSLYPLLYRFIVYYSLTRYIMEIGISPELIIGLKSGNTMAEVIAGIAGLKDVIGSIIPNKKLGFKNNPPPAGFDSGMEHKKLFSLYNPSGDVNGTLEDLLSKNKITTLIPLYTGGLKFLQTKKATKNNSSTVITIGINGEKKLALAIASLYEKGITIKWKKIYGKNYWQAESLPHYTFDRKPHWVESEGVLSI